MIALEPVEPRTSTTARNFDKLKRLVIDTAGRAIGIRWGTTTLTWPGASHNAGAVTVAHGLGRTPVVVIATGSNGINGGSTYPVAIATTYTSTTFVMGAATNDATSPVASATCPVAWVAIG